MVFTKSEKTWKAVTYFHKSPTKVITQFLLLAPAPSKGVTDLDVALYVSAIQYDIM